MEHPLKLLLQVQLSSDSSTVVHLSQTINSLTIECFEPSPHATKWTARINSLLHSKDAGARWAGLCLAQKTAALSRNLLMECAQNWLGIALPILSRHEPIPTLKASIRLITTIFSETVGVPEFQRQVSVSHVPKFIAALLSLIEKTEDIDLKVSILLAFTHLIPLYPTLHKPSHQSLYNTTLRFLNGSSPQPTNTHLLNASCKLFSVLPLTGGKVGAVNIWRKFMDETLEFGWSAFYAVRTTFAADSRISSPVSVEEAVTQVPLNLDRLKCCSAIICDLLSSPCQRAVQVPLGSLMHFVSALLRCTADDPPAAQFDPFTRTMEVAATPLIWVNACRILAHLAASAGPHLVPHLTSVILSLTYHLEQTIVSFERHFLMETVCALFQNCPLVDAPLVSSRLARAILPTVAAVLDRENDVQSEKSANSSNQDKKGKKRARAFEGDEIFKLSGAVLCSSEHDELALLVALDALRHILRSSCLSPAMQSLCSRVILSVLISLPQIPPSSLSRNLTLHQRVLKKVQEISTEISQGTSSVLSKSLGLVCRLPAGHTAETSSQLELMLHPRVPPLVRSLPHVENLSLFKAEETQDELDIRQELGLQVSGVPMPTLTPPQNTATPHHEFQAEAGDARMAEKDELPVVNDKPVAMPSSEPQFTSATHSSLGPAPNSPVTDPPNPPSNPPPSSHIRPPDVLSVESSYTQHSNGPRPGPSTSQTATVHMPRTVSVSMATSEDDEDEEMPLINMESDSEEEED